MKTIRFQLLLLALFVMVGCQKDEMSTSMKKGSYSLVASIENNDSTSRTAVDENGGVTWVATDAIGVIGTQTKNAKFESTGAGANVTFVGDLESSHEEPMLAYYPYDKNASLDGNALSFTLPSEYSYTGQSYAPMLGIKQVNGDFSFKHLVGLLKVTVKNMPENAKRLFVVSEGTEEKAAPAITGDVLVNDVTANNATLSITENKGHEVSIDLKNTSAQETYTFYIPVPVGEYPKLSVKLEMNDGVIYMDKSVSNVNMVRAMMLDMPVLDFEKEETGITAIVRGTVDIENPEGLIVRTLLDEQVLNSKDFSVEVFSNDFSQIVFVTDESDNILMMAREYESNANLKIDARSSALGIISMLPPFYCTSKKAFKEQAEVIMSSSKFSVVVSEMQKIIDSQGDIFSLDNTSFLNSIESLSSDLFEQPQSRAYFGEKIDGINDSHLDVRTTGNSVTIRNTGLKPPYECIVYYGGKEFQGGLIEAPEGHGIKSLMTSDIGEKHYGEPTFFTLTNQGEYYFFFDKNTEKAQWAYVRAVAYDALAILGLSKEFFAFIELPGITYDFMDVVKQTIEDYNIGSITLNKAAGDIVKSLAKNLLAGLEYVGNNYNKLDDVFKNDLWIPAVIDKWGMHINAAAPSYQFKKMMYSVTYKKKPVIWNLTKAINRFFLFYDVVKSIGNVATRLYQNIHAQSSIDFNLCYYQGIKEEIRCCSDTYLEILSGNEQTGCANETLEKPLVVAVNTISDDGNDYWNIDWHNRLNIKFEVVSGGFVTPELISPDYISRMASAKWTLGVSGEHKVRVVAIDKYTELEISEPVYFTAYFEQEEEEGTITTTEATNKTQTTATLSGNIQGYEADDFGHRYGIIYSTDANPTASNGTIVYSNNIQEDGNYSVDVASLTENTTYYYRAFVIEGGNYVYGDVMNLTTQKENMSERDILIAFYNATDGDNWKNNENWCSDKPLGEWYGVRTNDEGSVIYISLRRNNVRGNADLRGLSNLQRLDLDSNSLESLNLIDCNNLEQLNANVNSTLTTLDISGCNSLKSIQVKNCSLSYLDLSSCKELTNFSCENNKLTSLEHLSSLTTLIGLSCGNNQLTELNISGNRNLQRLYVESSQLTALDVSNFTKLIQLNCENNQLKSLDVSNLAELTHLYCENNQLESLDVSSLTNLLILDCDRNNLEELILPKSSSLMNLYCSNNKLEYLDLSGCAMLQRIGCLSNNLSSLNVSNSPLLVELNCSDNKISDLNTTNCTKIQILSVAVNKIKYLDVSYMKELERLYTQGNYIKQIYLPDGFTIFSEDYDRYYTFWEENGLQYPEFHWK